MLATYHLFMYYEIGSHQRIACIVASTKITLEITRKIIQEICMTIIWTLTAAGSNPETEWVP